MSKYEEENERAMQYWYQEAVKSRLEAKKYRRALEDLLDFKDDWKLKPAQAEIVNEALDARPSTTASEGEK